ncbi:hypothetical protein SDC9_136305 [bioreactor metagenome]|uniref:Uncharacterized protein n=1 Tax=bioreactor metagenome TaxID=1076179 RepID=A0A645DIW0_9ZZZZ
MLGQVIVGAVSHTPEFTPAKGIAVLKIRGCLGIEREFLGRVIAGSQVLIAQADIQEEPVHEAAPVVKPLHVSAGLAEEFQLHLLKFTSPENEVSGRDLIAEGLSDLADAKGHLLAAGPGNVLEVDEDALSRFGSEVHRLGGLVGHSDKGLEHQVKLANIGKVGAAAVGAHNVVLADVRRHLFKAHAVGVAARIFNQLVGAVAGLAVFAVHQRVRKAAHVAAGHPYLRVHQNGRVQPDVVRRLLHELFPPRAFHVVFKLDAQRAVVPRVGKAAIDLTAGKNKPPVFAKGNYFVHRLLGVIHLVLFPPISYVGTHCAPLWSFFYCKAAPR